MNKLFIFLFVMFCVETGYTQDRVAEYYKNVNKAELAICKSKYSTASKYYEKAFKTGVCFLRDLRHAFTIDYKYIGKESNVLEYAHKLAQRGVRISIINKVDSVKHPILYGQIKQIQDTTLLIYDTLILKELDTLQTIDQSYRKNGFAYQKENSHAADSLDLINYKVWLALYDMEDEAVKQTLGIFFFGVPTLLLRHNVPSHRFPEDLLWEQVKKGYLDARDYYPMQDLYIFTIGDAKKRSSITDLPVVVWLRTKLYFCFIAKKMILNRESEYIVLKHLKII